MTSSYSFNIKGCIEKYRDFNGARSWLVKAKTDQVLSSVVEEIYLWLFDKKFEDSIADEVLVLLKEFDSAGDDERRAELDKVRQQKKQEQLAREERNRIETEKLAQIESARAEQERLRREAENRKLAAIGNIDRWLKNDFLSADFNFSGMPEQIVTEEEFHERKIAFVRRWFEKEFSSSEIKVPDDEQLQAIAAANGNFKVVARAGSGKTSTLVNRTLFLVCHCNVKPQEILILAFNKKAVNEIQNRLQGLLYKRAGKTIFIPHVMTFHALACAIAYPVRQSVAVFF